MGPLPPPPPRADNVLRMGEFLQVGQIISSADRKFAAILEGDCNFAVYHRTGSGKEVKVRPKHVPYMCSLRVCDRQRSTWGLDPPSLYVCLRGRPLPRNERALVERPVPAVSVARSGSA